jgi:cyclopropane fatty-acyl-phospholipid synthase-like methyltransferase
MTHGNRVTSEDAASRLEIDEDHCVLEIGPGSGWGMRVLASYKPKRLVGVEISPRFRSELTALEFPMNFELHGDDALDMSGFFLDGSVDRLLAVNVVYFFDPLSAYAIELYRVMARCSRGLIACKMDLIETCNDAVFVNNDIQEISDIFEASGFKVLLEEVDLGSRTNNYTAIHLAK